MTSKTLTGTYSAGYTLSAGFTALTLTSTAKVTGVNPTTYGYAGGVGLTLTFAAPVSNSASLIAGGAGRFGEISGGMTASGPGGDGGNAVNLGGGGTFTNGGFVAAGAGGAGAFGFGGGHGGAGGVGVSLGAGGEVDSGQVINGGAGGAGGSGTYGGAGGAGGVALEFAAGGVVINSASIQGGHGGAGGARATTIVGKGSAGTGGDGGAGVVLTKRGTIDNNAGGVIYGGSGGAGGTGGATGAVNGAGGDGVSLAGGGVVSNSDAIHGGAGGFRAGGGVGVYLQASGAVSNGFGDLIVGGYAGAQAQAGAGVRLVLGGSVANSGVISGGYDQQGVGGDGVVMGVGATLTNLGFIYGGGASTIGSPGVGVDLASGAIYNGDFIRGGMVSGGDDGVGVYIRAGTVTNGGTSHPSAFIYGLFGVNTGSSAAVTVINNGTIGGPVWAVALQNASDRLVVGTGAVFEGGVHGGGGTLELAAGAETIAAMGGGAATISGTTAITITPFGTYVVDAAASLAFTGADVLNAGDLLISKGALSLAAGASLTIANGATAQVQGGVTSGGTIALVSTGARTDLRVLGAGATLIGGGTVTLSGPKSRIFGTATTAKLTNVDNTISGSGWIGLSEMRLQNLGVIQAVGKQGLVVNTKGETAVNSGIMEAAAGSVMTLQNTTFDQSGGGVLRAAAGGRLLLSDIVVIGGYLGEGGGGVINVNTSGGEFNGAKNKVEIDGAIGVTGGVSLTLDGAVWIPGKLNTHGGAKVSKLIVGPDGATLSGTGQVNLSASVNNIIVGATSGDVLTNVDDRIAGAGNIGDGSMWLINQAKGQIVGNTAVTLTIDTGSHGVVNDGTISSVSTGQVVVKSIVDNAGLLFAAAGTLTLDGAVTGTGTGQIKKGVLNIAASFGETVTFVSGATGQLRLTDWKDFTGAVKGLSLTGTNTIDLAGFTKTGATASYSGTTASGVLTVTNGTQTAKIHLTGNYTASTFTVANDGDGGVIVKDPPTASAAPLAQALAGFQHDPPPHLAATPAYRLPRFPMLHAQA